MSVIIPCFSAGSFLLEAVRSALDQTGDFDLTEVLIVDDRSDDEATLLALAQVGTMEKVKVLYNTGPKGSAAARNTGVAAARGDWIAFLDADDWMLAGSLQSRLAVLAEFPEAQWIGGDFCAVERDGTEITSGRFERNLATYHYLRPAYANGRRPILLKRPVHAFLEQAPTHTITGVMKRSLFNEVGGFDEALLRQQDYHLFIRLAAATDYVYVPKLVAKYRHHETNSTRSLTHTQEWRAIALRMLLAEPSLSHVQSLIHLRISQMHVSNSYEFRGNGQFLNAATSALKAIRWHAANAASWRTLVASILRQP